VAAADPTGDPALVYQAAGQLGAGAEAGEAAGARRLVSWQPRVRFRHPLIRSAAYYAAVPGARRRAHAALAEATDPAADPDRRAWHRAEAAARPDEQVAAELEQSAGRAQARGGLAAAAAFLERAAALTPDPPQWAGRALDAAQAKVRAGAFGKALELLAAAEAEPLGDFQRAHADLVRAQLAYVTSRGAEASPLLLKAARQLEQIDPGLSRSTYLDALAAGMFAGRLAGPGSGILEVARAAVAAPPPPQTPRAPDLLLDGLTAHYNDEYAAGVPMLRKALAAFGDGMSAEEELHWLWLAGVVGATRTWDHAQWDLLSARHVRLARETGALSELPLALTSRAVALLWAGELTSAASLIHEMQVVKEATGSGLVNYGALGLAALRGGEAEALALINATIKDATLRGEGVGITFAEWANALLNNGLGHHDKAAAAAQRACSYEDDLGSLLWPTVELVEAAARPRSAPDGEQVAEDARAQAQGVSLPQYLTGDLEVSARPGGGARVGGEEVHVPAAHRVGGSYGPAARRAVPRPPPGALAGEDHRGVRLPGGGVPAGVDGDGDGLTGARVGGGDRHGGAEHRRDAERVDGAHRVRSRPAVDVHQVPGRHRREGVSGADLPAGPQPQEVLGVQPGEHRFGGCPIPGGCFGQGRGGWRAAGGGEGMQHLLLHRPQPALGRGQPPAPGPAHRAGPPGRVGLAAGPQTGLFQRPPQRVHGGHAFPPAALALIHPARQRRDRPGDGERVVPIDQQGR
jgi:tetratricopeptide (TPR) repeat protein